MTNLTETSQILNLKNATEKLLRCLFPVLMHISYAESTGEPYKDSDVLLHYSLAGGSDAVTAGEIREAIRLANDALSNLENNND